MQTIDFLTMNCQSFDQLEYPELYHIFLEHVQSIGLNCTNHLRQMIALELLFPLRSRSIRRNKM